MDQRIDGQLKGVLLETLKKLDRNNQCVYPHCRKKPIASHIIAESVLKRIAHNGNILTWNWYEEEIVHSDPHDQDWERIYAEPKEASIGKDVTYPIFCATHDNDTFRSLEQPGFDGETEQVAQLAYRALCYKTWNPHVKARLEFLLSFTEPQLFVEQEPFLAVNALLEARRRLEAMIHMGEYIQLERRIITLDIAPCIACTDAFIPLNEDEEAALRNGLLSLTAEDILTFSFFLLTIPLRAPVFLPGSGRVSERITISKAWNSTPFQQKSKPKCLLRQGFGTISSFLPSGGNRRVQRRGANRYRSNWLMHVNLPISHQHM